MLNYTNPLDKNFILMIYPKLLTACLTLLFAAPSWAQLERCGTPERKSIDPNPLISPSDCGYSTNSPNPQYNPTFDYEIPVVFHVIQTTSGQGNLSASRIQDQVDILNEDFQALSGTPGAPGTNGRIRFRLATTDPQGNPTNGITYTTNNNWFNDNGTYYNTLAWDTDRYLNIYTNSASGFLGYVPDFPQSGNLVGSNRDRVVVNYSAVGYTSGSYNLGRTTTHEVGHYLGLYHTFDGGCGSSSNCYGTGDLICDTNTQRNPTYGCPNNANSCGNSDPKDNYMDYSDDVCMNKFTPEQINRMRCTLENWRPDLWDTYQSQEVVRLGTPPNPDALRPGQTRPPSAGQIWDPVVDHSVFMPSAVTDMIVISLNAANVYRPPFGTILCEQPFLLRFTNNAPGTPFNLAIPSNAGGVTFSAQAASMDSSGQWQLTNALDCTISN